MHRLELLGYEFLEQIAAGGMATIWKARQIALDRLVAVKMISTSSLHDHAALERFRLEAQAAARLNHPGIVQVYDAGENEGVAYIVMEYVDGQPVGELLQKRGRLSEAEALRIAEGVARALEFAWLKLRLVHCDVKPDNILVERDGSVKVADLGLARMIGARAEDSDLILGTPNYTSPEQAEGLANIDCRSDIYELGATLYHMVTGRLPFAGSPGSSAMEKHITDTLPDPMEVEPSVSPGMAWLIEKMMVKDREARPQAWSVVLADIEEVRKGGVPLGPLPEPGLSTVRRCAARAAEAPRRLRPMVRAPGAKRRVVVTREQVAQARSVVSHTEHDTGGAVRTFILLLLLTAGVYGAVWWIGVTYPFKAGGDPRPRAAAAPPTTEPDAEPVEEWRDYDPAAEPRARITPDTWDDAEFMQAARLFNGALDAYKKFQQTRTDRAVLERVQEDCREAIRLFESCRPRAPEGINVQPYITQCYGLIANARHSTLLSAPTGK